MQTFRGGWFSVFVALSLALQLNFAVGDEVTVRRVGAPPSCGAWLSTGKNAVLGTAKVAAKTIFFVPFFMSKTIAKAITKADGGEPSLIWPWNRTDKFAIVLYFGAWLTTGGTPLDHFSHYRKTAVSELAPHQDYFDTSKGPMAIIDGAHGKSVQEEAIGKNRADGRRIFYTPTSNAFDFLKTLRKSRDALGHPPHRSLLAVHGEPGVFLFDDETVDEAWLDQNHDRFEAESADLMGPDAEVILVSCYNASGSNADPLKGERFIRRFFSPILRRGGTVYASNRLVYPSMDGEYFFVRDLTHIFGALVDPFYWANQDPVSRAEKTRVIVIPPR